MATVLLAVLVMPKESPWANRRTASSGMRPKVLYPIKQKVNAKKHQKYSGFRLRVSTRNPAKGLQARAPTVYIEMTMPAVALSVWNFSMMYKGRMGSSW